MINKPSRKSVLWWAPHSPTWKALVPTKGRPKLPQATAEIDKKSAGQSKAPVTSGTHQQNKLCLAIYAYPDWGVLRLSEAERRMPSYNHKTGKARIATSKLTRPSHSWFKPPTTIQPKLFFPKEHRSLGWWEVLSQHRKVVTVSTIPL